MSNIFTTIWNDIESCLSSPVGQTVTDFIATGAGITSAIAVIEEANPTNKAGTANDVALIANAAVGLLGGTSAPTLPQIQSVFAALKTNDSLYATLANTLATSLFLAIQKYDGAPWLKVAQAYVNGWAFGANALGASNTSLPTAPITAPVSAPAATA